MYTTNNYPTSIQDPVDPIASDNTSAFDHAGLETFQNESIKALKDKVGADGSAVTSSHDYKLSEVTSTDKAVGKTATQTLTNKTLTSPTVTDASLSGNTQIDVGSDTTGDLLVRKSTGKLGRIAAGTTKQMLVANGTGTEPTYQNLDAVLPTQTGNTGRVLTTNGTTTSWETAGLGDVGNGSDGALSISSGTTTIDCLGAAVVVKQYTSISITGTGNLAFSNPNANGTLIILKSQGNVTLTSSSSAVIDLRNMGAAGGSAGNNGTTANSNSLLSSSGGAAGTGGGPGSGGTISISVTGNGETKDIPFITIGAGGGGPQTGATGAGGRGAGSLLIKCGGAFNFTTGTIKANGTQGTAGGNGIGGSGGSGSVFVFYKTLTANSGTIDVASTAGLGTGGGSYNAGGGGAGASNGSAGVSLNLGGAGGAGVSSVKPFI